MSGHQRLLIRQFKAHKFVNSVCVTPDNKHVVSASGGEFVNSVCVTPDNKHVVSAPGCETIRITRIIDGKLIREINGRINSFCVTPDGKHVITGFDDKKIRITRQQLQF